MLALLLFDQKFNKKQYNIIILTDHTGKEFSSLNNNKVAATYYLTMMIQVSDTRFIIKYMV